MLRFGFYVVLASALASSCFWLALEYGGLRRSILIHARAVVFYDAREVRFGILDGAKPLNPTALRFGPDNRLYVGEQGGRILAYTVDRPAAGEFRVSHVEVIENVRLILNHNDDGSPAPSLGSRLLTGLVSAGTVERPVLYVASSDPRLYNEDADTNSGIVSRLTWDGSAWIREDLVRGLPRSRSDHAPNGLWLDEGDGLLYVTVGGNTNSGAPSRDFHMLAEYALSASILKINLKGLQGAPYDLDTLDDEDRPGHEDRNDPFGGNEGKNQAILSETGPVTLYASGLRNAYRLTRAAGAFFTIDNGPNQDIGGPPVWREGRVTNEPSEEIEHHPSVLLRIPRSGYYGGHPNPSRADRRNTFNDSNPQSPVAAARPEEGRFIPAGGKDGELLSFRQSVNGIVTYPSMALGRDWNGCLLIAGWDRIFRLVCISEEGEVERTRVLVRKAGYLPLDVTAQPDDGPFPGSIWAADHAADAVTFVEPVRESGPFQLARVVWRDLLVWTADFAISRLGPPS